MTSAHLLRLVEAELRALHGSGRGELVAAFLSAQRDAEFPRLDRYVDALQELIRRAEAAGCDRFALLLRHIVGRTLAYPLDRPGAAVADLVALVAELARGRWRGSVFAALTQVELLRAWHKIDAPGHRDAIVGGVRELWPRLADDPGPLAELLDIFWRTAWWCGDVALMREGRRLARERTELLRYSASYWQAREFALEGRHGEAAELLRGLLDERSGLQDEGQLGSLYLEVDLAAAEVALRDLDAAARRIERVERELRGLEDPMLRWELARSRAALAAARGDRAQEAREWSAGLERLLPLGTDRLAAEFAVALGEAAAAAALPECLRRARTVLEELLPRLRSAADLEARARRVPGLYSRHG